jgi:signal transduction histidine kinase
VLVQDDRGGLFVGGGGLLHIPFGSDEVRWLTGPTTDGTLRNVQSILRDKSGKLWIGDEFNLLFRVELSDDYSRVVEVQNARLLFPDSDFGPATAVRDMIQTDDGLLWLASDGGLIRFNPVDGDTRTFGVADGLPSNTVSSLVEVDDRLWVATGRGIAVFSVDEQTATPVVDPSRAASGEFNRRAKWRDHSGRIWFGGGHGLIHFDPREYVQDAATPPVVITAIRKTTNSGVKNLSAESGMRNGITLAPGEQSVAFDYTALDFIAPGNYSFAHRIEPGGEWVLVGGNRSIRFSGLAPGRYEFQVAIRSGEIVHTSSAASVPLIVLPRVSQTWWFRAGLVALLFAVLYGLHRMRVSRLLHVERLRSRIAGDLHDDIGSNLSSIALLSDLVSGNPHLPDAEKNRLAQISNAARQMVGSLREIVWSIDPNRDRLEDLVDYLHEIAATIADGRILHFESRGELAGAGLGLLERRAIVMMCREVLTNAVRHSGADEITFIIESSGGSIHIKVADNGRGFDPANASNGYGLRSIHTRAESIAAHVRIDSRANGVDRGTTVYLIVPLDKHAADRLRKESANSAS